MRNTLLLLVIFISIISCEKSETNTAQETLTGITQLDAKLLLIQNTLPEFIEEIAPVGAQLVRIEHLFGDYYRFDDPTNSNRNTRVWEKAYNDLIPLIEESLVEANQLELYHHLGVLKTIKAYVYLSLADVYGKIPYFDETHPQSIIYSETDLWNILVNELLVEAIENFNQGDSQLDIDMYYNNDFTKWIKFANTLKLESYLKAGDINGFNSVINSGNYILSTADDFQYRYGVPNGILEHYDYESQGFYPYQSIWLMDKMVRTYDPRIRFYFYRQVECVPGNVYEDGSACPIQNNNYFELLCLSEPRPTHYLDDMVFCSASSGYWGRDHGNSLGIPPDTEQRTIPGVYPTGGKFDGNEFININDLPYDGGQGITPMMLASWVDFMRAEVAMNNGDYSGAQNFLISGLQKSIDKVIPFSSIDPSANTDFIPQSSEIEAFLFSIEENFANASNTEKWNILAEEFFITQYGNGIGAYNFYRRKGYPTEIQFHLNQNSGAFVRSLLYPTVALENFPNLEQKPNAQVQLFWDTNPAYPIFPIAN